MAWINRLIYDINVLTNVGQFIEMSSGNYCFPDKDGHLWLYVNVIQ